MALGFWERGPLTWMLCFVLEPSGVCRTLQSSWGALFLSIAPPATVSCRTGCGGPACGAGGWHLGISELNCLWLSLPGGHVGPCVRVLVLCLFPFHQV